MKRFVVLAGAFLAAVCAVGLAAPLAERAAAGEMTVTFLDVGQGDAVLIRTPDGKTALVDAGPSGDVVAQLRAEGVQKIDLVVASHHHADHIGGMAAVVDEFEPRVYVESGSSHTSKTYQKLLKAVTAVEDCKTVFPKANKKERVIRLGDAVKVRIFPRPPEDEDNENNNCVGLRVEHGDCSVLLTGDSEDDQRDWWRTNADPSLYKNATVMKVAHHGSYNGTDPGWLADVNPKLAVISCSADNNYGHPHARTTRLLDDAGVPLKRTDRDGAVVVKSDGTNVVVATRDRARPGFAGRGVRSAARPDGGWLAPRAGPTPR